MRKINMLTYQRSKLSLYTSAYDPNGSEPKSSNRTCDGLSGFFSSAGGDGLDGVDGNSLSLVTLS